MAKPHRRVRGARRSGASSTNSNPPMVSSGGYEAPTAGYEDVLYAHGTTKAAALIVTVNMKLARYVSVQSWGGATIAGQAMEKLAEPTLIEPARPSPTEEYENIEKGQVPDPDNEGQSIEGNVSVTRTRDVPDSLIKAQMDIYMIHYKHWLEETRQWKNNRARLYALILQHCPPDLEEVLKTMSPWKTVSSGYDAVGLLRMVKNVAHDQTEAKQTVMGFVESTAE
jgi:hypothetical protein